MARKKRVSKKQQKSTKPLIMGVLSLLCLIGFGLGAYQLVMAKDTEPIVVQVDPNVGLEARVVDFFTANDAPEMIPIIKCESNFTHYNANGSVLQNRAGSSATGIAQILTSAHPDPKVLYLYNKRFNTELTIEDFDITTIEGNLGYALMLYELRGTRDWECAKKFRFTS